MEIIKKTYKNLFEKVLSGEKNFDVRLGDMIVSKGDILILREIDENRNLTGREIKKRVSFILRTKELDYWSKEDVNKFGFAVLQLE